MYKRIFYLKTLKEMYKELNMELKNLSAKKGATESGGRKSQGYTNVMNARNDIKAEYDELKSDVLNWLESTYSDAKYSDKLKCYRKYFDSISESDLQSVIDSLYPPSFIAFTANKEEGKKVPLYKASNLKQALRTSCLREIENR